jgi:hypothetical protein
MAKIERSGCDFEDIFQVNWFTLDSTFHNPMQDYGLDDEEDVERVWRGQSETERATMLFDFIRCGLQVLGLENPNEYIRLAAQRLIALFKTARLEFLLAAVPEATLVWEFHVQPEQIGDYLVSHAAPVFCKRTDGTQVVMFTPDWLKAAVARPLDALAYLLRAASYARDDSFDMLEGSDWVAVRGFGMVELPRRTLCEQRAQALVSELLNQAFENDQTIFHRLSGLEAPLDEIRAHVMRAELCEALMYRDPPAPGDSHGAEA